MRYFPGWMYYDVEFLASLYDRLHFQEMVDDYKDYERPPGVSKTDGQRMPL